MLLRRFTDIYPKELARDMREFFNSLLSGCLLFECHYLLAMIGGRCSKSRSLERATSEGVVAR